MSQECNAITSGLGLRPLSARSVVASVLMANHPPELPAALLVRLCERFGIAAGTTRVALSRMVAAGELSPVEAGYRLAGPPLLARKRAQDEARTPPVPSWDGDWRVAVVVSGGRGATERAELRRALSAARFAEWREGVWLRPANLPPPDRALGGAEACRWLVARPDDDPVELAGRLWDLAGWGRRGRELLAATDAEPGDLLAGDPGRPMAVFTAAAALLRHLRTDPLLPPDLLPPGWPGDELRARYTAHAHSIEALIRDLARVAATG
jgi:phenylacetic acid degradation operon negative regulatory protein